MFASWPQGFGHSGYKLCSLGLACGPVGPVDGAEGQGSLNWVQT